MWLTGHLLWPVRVFGTLCHCLHRCVWWIIVCALSVCWKHICYASAPKGRGHYKTRSGVRPSVSLFVPRPNSRTEKPRKPKIYLVNLKCAPAYENFNPLLSFDRHNPTTAHLRAHLPLPPVVTLKVQFGTWHFRYMSISVHISVHRRSNSVHRIFGTMSISVHFYYI